MEYEMTIEQLRTQCQSIMTKNEDEIARLRSRPEDTHDQIHQLEACNRTLDLVLWCTRPKE